MLNSRVPTLIRHLSLSMLASILISANTFAQSPSFDPSDLQGASISLPTSLQFGPDDRLYVSQQDGTIKAFTVVRNAANDYEVTATETIDLIKNNVQNHDDDGSTNTTSKRQVTGLLVTGTANEPVLYVSSSDWRIGGASGGTDKDLDTNSGVISRLTCTGGISAGACQDWEHVDLVRGLPRSEENHSTNGMDLDEASNMLYVMSGGHANKGAPSNNFAGTPEYYLSGALLSVDLDMIESMPVQTDTSTSPETKYVYDLPTLDDPTRNNINGIEDPTATGYNGIDVNDPFGGNNGLNQAVPEPGGPVQVHSPGYRNAYDVVLTESGELYTWDNGPNGGWGGQPLIYDGDGNLKGVQLDGATYDPGAGDYCTNEFSEDGSAFHGDQLHVISGTDYYGGHPAPLRAFPDLSGIIVYEKDGSGAWVQQGPTYALSALLPAGLSIGDFPQDPEQCNYSTNDPAKYLEKVNSSTNGIAEYLGSNFVGEMQGDILAAAFNGNIYRCKPDGAGGLVDLAGNNDGLTNDLCEVLFSGFGAQPLDITTLGDGAPFPGTVWVASIGSQKVTVFEPNDFLDCDASDPFEDSDGDGFTNGDEADNGTDPCSAASKPDDFDGDGVSDLKDADDDNDGIDDVDDPFPLDDQNGLGTPVPLDYPFFNTDPGTGLFGLGFTGLMLPEDGMTTWLDLFDEGQLAAGGTSGLMTIENVTGGDAFGAANTQENGFQFGADIDTDTQPVIISTRVLPPYFNGEAPQKWQSLGFFIGTGDQDNYLKVALNHNDGAGGVEVLLEDGPGSTSSTQYENTDWNSQDILSAGQVDLMLTLDPQAGTAQPQISLDQGDSVFDLGGPVDTPGGWLDPNDSQGLAIGIVSTSNGPSGGAPAFDATWDFLKVENVNLPPAVDPIADQTSQEGDISAVSVAATDSDGPENLNYSATGLPPGLDIEFTNGQIFGTIDDGAATNSPYEVTVTVSDGLNSSQIDFTWTVTATGGSDPVLFRVNAGGPEIMALDSGPDWTADTAASDSTYLANAGSNGVDDWPTNSFDTSVPLSTPQDVFLTERWDDSTDAAGEMLWNFPTGNGDFRVRLHMKNGWDGSSDPGQRIFDVAVEGSVPAIYDDLDLSDQFGHRVAVMLAHDVTVSDGSLDIEFIHGPANNPTINAIEIIELGAGGGNTPPVADAGADQSVDEGDLVTLDGSASSDTDPLAYSWTQLSGPGVTLSDANGAMPSFTAPEVSSQQTLVFELTVDDGTDNDTDTVTVTVNDVSTGGGTLADAQFQQVALPVTDGGFYTSVTVGPDDKLYAMNINADIHRWSINADGTLANDEQVLTTINDVETDGRSAIGLVFDPAATAGNLIAWVTHVEGGQGGGDKFSGKITRLSGANLETAQDFVTGLPRSTGDHWVNSLAFGPAGDLYVNVGSMSAMGALDGSWNDTETLLSAATLRVDVDAITSPPLDVQTEAGGSYDPFAGGAQVTIFGQGVRNAYDLVWHSNGFLYVPTNGSAPGNTPASDAADICPDGLNYSGPSVPALNGVSEQPDFLFKVEQGGYYGHPNPTLCNYVLNGGNPTAGSDLNEVSEYPVGTATDADYVAADAVLDFAVFGSANSHSPNGVVEYQSASFDGGLQGSLLVARFHKSDIVAIRPDMSSGDIIETSAAIPGLGGLSNPLDVTEDSRNGNLYVSETQGAFTITLLRPLGAGVPNIDADQDELIYSGVQGTAGEVQSVVVTNNGTADLNLTSVALAGSNASDFAISADPAPETLQPGEQATVEVQFTPGSGVTGALSALLQINSNDADEPTLEVALFGLSAQGLEGGGEPPLQTVIDTLGYSIDVGGTALSIGGDPNPIGDEVAVSLFRKSAGDSPVTIEAVARYSPDWVLPFGWYQPDGTTPILNQVGELSGASSPPEHQTLFPEQISGSMSFDPGSQVFGLYTTSPSHTAFTEDALNNGAGIEPHSARVYPLSDRSGNAIPNSFLVAFEEASNTDYQDYVFVIRNALPAQPAGSGCAPISPLDCPQVPVNLPVNLDWDLDEGGVGDASDIGTGFTMVDPPSNGDGYLPANLAVNTVASTLDISTTDGIQFGPTGNNPNSLDNGLGVAFDADVQSSLMETTLVDLPAAPGDFAQAGLWLFLDESHYVKLVALSRDTNGWEIQLNYEQDNETVEPELESGADVAGTGDDVSLALDIDPVSNQVTALYSINGGTEQMLGPIDVDPALLAGKPLPDGSGPLSFGGIFATQRNAAQQVFSFEDFALSLTGTVPNLPPQVSNPGNQIGLEGDVVSLQISANDPDGDDASLTYAASGLPDGLSIDTSTGLISGTIAADANLSSPFAVSVTVSDVDASTDVNFNWVVSVPGDINSGLLLHWPFDETGGLVANDISGNNNDGAVSASGAAFVAGQLGNAIQLDGVAGFVADDDAESFLNGLEQITVTTWVKADNTPTDEGIFTTANPDNKDEFLAMRYDATGFAGGETAVIKAAVGNGEQSGNFSVLETSSNVQTTDWQHLALVWELGAPAQVYIDGVLNTPSDVTGTMAAALNAVDRLWVGRASKFDNGEFGWQGLIDDFRIYGRVLAASEIQQLAIGDTGGGNNPPGVTNPADQTSTEGDVISLQIDASDADAGDTLIFSATGLPDGLGIDPASGLISGTIASSAVADSPFTVEIAVTDGTDPVTVQFQWIVSEPADPVAAADVAITPNGGLTATTFSGDAFVITNTGDYPITSVSIDLSTALLADNVFDPIGAAGDAGAKCLTPNSGAAATGFVAPVDPCVDPFANPHDGGFEILTINFDDFGPGESFGFSIDIDPTSIKNATGTGDAGSVSGLELTGSTVTMNFDDGGAGVNLIGQTFQIAPNSQGGSLAQLREVAPSGATLSASGPALLGIDLASPDGVSGPFSHAAASVPNAEAAQTIVVNTGIAGDEVRLLQVEAELLAVNGFELEPFEANEAIVVSSQTATTGADGTVSIPVTLTRTNPTVGGYNYFAAVVDGPDGSSVVSNYIILRLESPAGGNQPPVANNDLAAITAGQQAAMIDLLGNDSDADGVLDASSIVIVDAPTQGTLTPGALGVFEYDHTGGISDSFTYTVNDNEAATSNLATAFIQVQLPALPDDVDGDGEDNITDNDDDNDGFLDTEDPFALDADNGTGTDLPVRLPLFSEDPGTGLFGLGFTGLMSNGEIGGAQGDDYLDLFDPSRIFIDDDPSGNGTLTILNIPNGDAFEVPNDQQDAFQLGLNVDINSQPFVVHTRMLAPFFDNLPPQNFQSQGLFIGTGDQDNYLKMVVDGAGNDIELLLEVDGAKVEAQSGNFGGANDFLAAGTVDLYLVVDPTTFDPVEDTVMVAARLALDDGAMQTIETVEIPGDWLTPGDGFGLAAGLIATSFGTGPSFDATWDRFEAFHLTADDQFDVLEDSGLNVLDVLANDFDEAGLTITAVGATDNGGTAVVNGNSIDYTPAPDFSGIETFTYTVENADGTVATTAVAVNVLPVNDAPSVTLAGDQQALEDAGPQTIADFATGFAPGGGADEAGQAVAGFVVTNDNNALFSTQPAIDVNGDLTYQSAPNVNGTATVTVQVMDDGGTANGGVDLSAGQTFVINITPVNDAPSISLLGDQTVAEDAGAQSVLDFAFDFNPGGGADEAVQNITGFMLSNDSNALFAVQPEVATDGTLTYTPAADANGVATVTVSVLDDGGVANGGVNQSVEQTFLITVTPQNDPPVITAPADVAIDEETATNALAFTVNDVETAADSLLVSATSSDQSLLPDDNIVLGGTGANRTVALTPADDHNGSAVITLAVTDADTGSAQGQFTLTVNAVNDAPSIAIGADQNVVEDAVAQSLAGFATGFAPGGGTDEDGQSIAEFVVGNDNPGLFDTPPAIAPDGTLTYAPAADTTGAATVSVQVRDDGGTANGGTDLSDAQTFKITVTEQADASITKTAAPDPVLTGGSITYTITVANAGPSTASNVVVTETLPAGVTLNATSGCADDPVGVPTCSLGDISEGGQASFTVTVDVGEGTLGELVNNVWVETDTTETGILDNAADATVTARQAPALEISTLDFDFGPVLTTESATTSFTLTNTGDPITTITLDAPVLAGATDPAFSIVGGDCAAGTELVGGDAGCTVDVQFDPVSVAASFAGTLEVDSDADVVSASLAGSSELPDWVDGFDNTDPGSSGFEQNWTFQAFDGGFNPLVPATMEVTGDGYLQIRDPDAEFAVGFVPRTFEDTRTSALVNADGFGSGSDSGDGLDNQIDQGVIARFDPASLSGYAAYMRMELDAQELVLIKFDGSNVDPPLIDLREQVADSADPDWAMGRMFEVELDAVDQPDGSVRVIARAIDAQSGALLARLEFVDLALEAFDSGFSGVLAIANATGLNGTFDTTSAISSFASAHLAPESIDFGAVPVGFAGQQTVLLSNNGNDALQINGITVTGDAADDYELAANACTASLPGGATCSFDVTFDASVTGVRAAEVVIDSSASTSPDLVMLNASVFEAQLALSPSELGFGAVPVGEAAPVEIVTVTNAGNAVTSLSLTDLETTGDFSIEGGDCAVTTTLSGGQSCTVEISFAPQTVGSLVGSLQVQSDKGTDSVSLAGIGLEGASLVIGPAKIVFGAVTLGESATASFTLSNTGDPASTLAIGEISTTGNTAFEITGGSCQANITMLDGQDSCTLDVGFGPQVLGLVAGLLNVESSANSVSGALAGEGTGPAVISVTPSEFDFGTVRVGEPESATFSIENSGGSASSLILGNIETIGPRFEVVGGSCASGGILAGGDTCTLSVQLAPLVTGEYDGLLVIESSAGPVQAEVAGSGLNEVDLQISGTSDPQIPVVGTDVVYSLTVENLNAVGDATGVMINSSQVPEGLELVSSSGCVEAPAVPNCTIGEIEAGGSASVVLRFSIPSDASDIISLAATVTADQQDPQLDNNLVEFSSVGGLGREADLFTNLHAVEFVPSSMTEVEFTVLFGNLGPSDVTGAAVGTDLGSILTRIEWTCEAQSGAVCEDPSGSGDVSSFVDLAVGTSVTFSVSASLTEPDKDQEGTSLSVIVEPEDVNDLDQSNNEAEFEVRTGIFADGFEASATP